MYSLKSPHRGESNEYTKHTIIYRNAKRFLNYHYFLPDLASRLTLSGSSYPYLEQISMIPKMFEPLRFGFFFFHFFVSFNYESFL